MNLCFCAYAYKKNHAGGANVQTDDAQNVYLKNAFVALKSCKLNNPSDDVALITNLKLSQYWVELFEKNDLLIFYNVYDDFVFDKEYGWSLAFYKLCALQFALKKEYENYILLDTDTYTQRTFSDVWVECKHNVLLPEINRGLYNGDYRIFCEEAQHFLETDEYLTRCGGEFIAGNRQLLQKFLVKCHEVYEQMVANGFVTINGDEFIESVAAWSMRDEIKSANAYVFRYWTAYRWHYVCSNFHHNPVCVLHCPREKDHGFVKLYNYMARREGLPSAKKVYSLLHLNLFGYIVRNITMKIDSYVRRIRKC